MLKKLEFYYDEGEKVDIEDEKIYWDTIRNQFRHKFNCCDCGKPLDCMCYDSLTSALTGVNDGLVCDDCGIKYAIEEMSVDDLLYELDDERKKKVDTFLETLVTEDEIKEFKAETGCKTLSCSDMREIIEEGDKEDTLKDFVIGLLSKEEKWEMWSDICDGYPEGESCNI